MTSRRVSGPLRLGVPAEVAAALRDDPRVVWQRDTPVLTPIEHLPWWSPAYFEEQGVDLGHVAYVDWDAVAGLAEPELGPTGGVGEPGLWVTEIPAGFEDEAEATVQQVAGRWGRTATRRPLLADEEAVEEYWVCRLEHPQRRSDAFDLRTAWRAIVGDGRRVDGDPDGASLAAGRADELDVLWELYCEGMRPLSLGHPIQGTLERAEFDALVTGAKSCAVVLRSAGEPVSVALMSTDLEHFGWIDPRWFDAEIAPMSPNTMFIPGIVTRLDRRLEGRIDQLLSVILDFIEVTRLDLTILFPCNNLSRHYTPRLTQQVYETRTTPVRGRVERVASCEFAGFEVG